MIKFRVWDKLKKKFIYPVLDICNDFHIKYPADRFTFDRFIPNNRNIELYQNDIIIVQFFNRKSRPPRDFPCVIMNDTSLQRFDDYLFRNHSYPCIYPSSIGKFSTRYGDWADKCTLIGNVHENMDYLEDFYKIIFS